VTLLEEQRLVSPTDATYSKPLGLGGSLIGTLAGILLAGLVPTVVVLSTESGRATAGWQLALVVLIWSGIRLGILIGRASAHLCAFTFWLFCYIWFGLAGIAQLRTNSWPSTVPGVETTLIPNAYWIIIAGMGMFEIGTLVRWSRMFSPRPPRLVTAGRSTALGIFGSVVGLYFIQKVGVSVLFGSREQLSLASSTAWSEETGILVRSLSFVPLLVAVHALARLRQSEIASGLPAKYGFRILIFLIILLVRINPISSPRYVFGTVFISLLLPLGAFRTPKRTRATMSLIIAGLIFLFPYADKFRHDVQTAKPGLLTSFETSGDYDALGQVANTLTYVAEHGSTNGNQALGVALFWVPRSVWPSKPQDTGILLAENRGYLFTNLSTPIWAELYINGLWPALVIGMLLLGVGARKLDSALVGGFSASLSAVLATSLAYYLFIILRGSLLPATSYLVFMILSAWVIAPKHRSEKFRGASFSGKEEKLKQTLADLPAGAV
jgi:hypothetical protein